MAKNRYRGDAPAVKQVQRVTPANVTVGNVFTLTRNGKSVSFTATVATVANVTAGLAAAVAASTIAEFLEVDAADATTYLTLTAKTAGMPFTITSSAATGTGSAGCTLTSSTTTANSGPYAISTPANWTTGALPNNDDVIFDLPGTKALYDLEVLAGNTLTSVSFEPDWDGECGLPDVNQSGSYYEDKPKFLKIACTHVTNNSKSGRVKIDFQGTNGVTFDQRAAGNPIQGESYAVNLKGTGNAGTPSTLNLMQGVVGVAVGPGETAAFAAVNIGSLTAPATDVDLTFGAGATIVEVNQVGGDVKTAASVTSWTQTTGDGTTTGTAAIGTLSSDDGTLNWQSTGNITAQLNLGNDATLNRSQYLSPVTVAAATIKKGATVNDPGSKITWTTGIDLDRCGLEDVTLNLGKNINVMVS